MAGVACSLFFQIAFNPLSKSIVGGDLTKIRGLTASTIQKFLLAEINENGVLDEGGDYKDDNVTVFTHNHPSLAESLYLLAWALQRFPDEEIAVPINLPWHSQIQDKEDALREVGIVLLPIITPALFERMGEPADLVEPRNQLVDRFNAELNQLAESGGGVCLLAPQATRKATIYEDETQAETGISEEGSAISPTIYGMSLFAKQKRNLNKFTIIPTGVTLPDGVRSNGLNMGKQYHINLGEAVSLVALTEKYNAYKKTPKDDDKLPTKDERRTFMDRHVLNCIAELVPESYRYPESSSDIH